VGKKDQEIMSDELIRYLSQRIEAIESKQDANFKSLSKDIRELLKFKWQALGALALINVLMFFGFNIAMNYIK